VVLCGRTARGDVEVRPDGEEPIVVPGPVHTDPAAVAGAFDLVFLAVKSTQIVGAGPWLASMCGSRTVVCVLQNGVEQEELVGPLVGAASVVPAVVWFPAETQSAGWVWLRGTPRLTLPDRVGSRVVVDALRGSRCVVEVSADFTSAAWLKLMQNAVAGLMALTGRRAGMFRRDDIAELATAYLRECLAVARAEGADVSDDAPAEIVARFQGFPVDMGTSILADRTNLRPLEWEVRNGVVVRRAREHGIPVPVSEVVAALLAATSDGPG
jgi:2-dehydropantoate 2-reductase